MTTAHRPTFDPARGKDAQKGPAYHQRLLPAYTQLKVRQPGQGGDADHAVRDLRADLLKAEAAHRAKISGTTETASTDGGSVAVASDLLLEGRPHDDNGTESEEDRASKRQRILEESREVDADSDGEDEASSSDESDEEDETAELLRELEKIKKERAEQREREERERAAKEQELREHDLARGNPLLNSTDFNIKRRWDDDVVFKNQARGTETRKKEFVNDLLRSDFHKRFMDKYVR
ncbi:MAG: hypothetical protein M1826_003237 [Phylliscum demangeonii]|nr:MAG: hypothetical protein M1826_003237 [Phylliscum demangeonii]